MSMGDIVEQTVGIIPVVVTAGVAMKMVDWMGSKMQPTAQPASTKKLRPKRDVYSRSYSGPIAGGGSFSNVGF